MMANIGNSRISKKIGIVGGGAWGTALAVTAIQAQAETRIWVRDASVATSINKNHENPKYLPGAVLPISLVATTELKKLVDSDILLMVIPTQQLRSVFKRLTSHWPADRPLILCSKGIERSSGKLPADIIREIQPNQTIAVLSGPSFASDVVAGKPTAVTLASESLALSETLSQSLASPSFRPYASDDITGVEIGGALKNVTAVCCGISAGRELGASAGAALMARGYSELVRFGIAHGAKAETFMGLSGFGDLVLTCSSLQSRNYSFGHGLGAGTLDIADAAAGRVPLAEGAFTASIAAQIAIEKGLDLPILRTVSEILDGSIDIGGAIHQLLDRPLKPERL